MGTKQQLEDGRIDMPDLVVSHSASVPPARIYATLADLSTHTTWAGSMHGKKNFGLRTLEASADPAVVGTEFRQHGRRPDGVVHRPVGRDRGDEPLGVRVRDRRAPRAQEAGKPACDTRITYRFEIAPAGAGSTVTYRVHISKWTNAPAALRSAALRPIARMATKSYAKKMLRNLATYASEH